MGELGGGGPHPRRSFVGKFVLYSAFWDLNVYVWRILRTNDAQKAWLALKNIFQQKLLNLRHILIDTHSLY